jgi:flagellar motility protein MotE (MotC chaperone)
MNIEDPISVEDKIVRLAEETGAPTVFVEQVRCLFQTKNINLADSCTPYTTALEEAFRREASIRRDTVIAKKNLARLKENFDVVGTKYKAQLARLKQVRDSLDRSSAQLSSKNSAVRSSDPRSFITKKQSDALRMVPGPKEVQ